MTTRALVTGITGQDGRYLAQLLLAKGYTVYGLVREGARADALRQELPEVHCLPGDLLDVASLQRAMVAAAPQEVYNLASQSSVGRSWSQVHSTCSVSGTGVLNVLEAAREHDPGLRFFQASSSEMFGKAQESPQTEQTRLWPRSPYGAAKAFGHHITVTYRESYGMHASSGIMYNHESPRRSTDFVTRKITLAVARIRLGLQQTVSLGDLDAERDWGFAGDYVEAMHRMLQQDEPDDYVLATGESHSIREFLGVAFEHVGLTDWDRYVVQDPRFLRPAEVERLVGDAGKAAAQLGWKPQVGFEELVRMMVDNDLETTARDLAGRAVG